MEITRLPSSLDQSISPYKQIQRNPKRNIQRIVSGATENFVCSNLHGRGLFIKPPPSPSSSFSFYVLNAKQQQQPPLLPLPIPKPYSPALSRNRGLLCPPKNRRISRSKGQDLSSKKLKPSTSPKKQDLKENLKSTATAENLVITSTDRLGPDPSDLPTEVSRVLKSAFNVAAAVEETEEELFYLSPPPSSLPLPKFSLRPKFSCNVEAGGIDASATDDLRRLLRLR